MAFANVLILNFGEFCDFANMIFSEFCDFREYDFWWIVWIFAKMICSDLGDLLISANSEYDFSEFCDFRKYDF